MKLIEKDLEQYEALKIFSIIDEVLTENRNTQIFVDSDLFFELLQNGKKSNVKETYCDNATYHYAENRIRWLKYFIKNEEGEEKIINVASFVYNSFNYVQIVEFSSNNFARYVHSCEKLDQILIINKA